MLAIAAGGTYVIYVVLTCAFYFVGLAYENVSEVTGSFCSWAPSTVPVRRGALAAGRCGSSGAVAAPENEVPFSA